MSEIRRNIIIVMDDQHHHRYLGCMGHPVVKTPHLDAFAAASAVFTNAFTSCPLCTPARVSLLTGMYPHATQIYTNNPDVRIRSDLPLLPNALRRHGYHTGTTGKYHADPLGGAEWDMKDDVSRYNHVLGARGKERAGHYLGASLRRYPSPSIACSISPVAEDETRTAYEASAAMRFLDERPKDKPFFLWMNFDAPHGPCHLTRKYAEMYDPASLPLPNYPMEKYGQLPLEQREWASFRSYDTMTDDQLRRALAYYCGAVSEVDHHFGALIKRLKTEGIYDDTIVVFLADHGDHAGDHRWVNKSFAYDSTIRIPLLCRVPGAIPCRHDDLVQNVDLFPSLCDLLGMEKPAGLQGNSLAGLLFPGSTPYVPRDRIVSEELHYRTVRTKTHKLIYAPPCHPWAGGSFTSQLYDLEKDPGEWDNLFGIDSVAPARAKLLEMLLDSYCATEHPLEGDLQKITCTEHFSAYGAAYAAQKSTQDRIAAAEPDDFAWGVYLPSKEADSKPSLGGG
jgi:arylsulfatase A-like enzyme